MIKKIVVCLFSIFFSIAVFGQPVVEQKMADNYFKNGNYEAALPYYQKLYQSNSSPFYLSRLVDCQINLGNFSDAEKILKKTVKKTNNPLQHAQLGYVYERQEKLKAADKQYGLAYSSLRPKQYDVIGLARYYRDLGKNKLALQVYEFGVANVENFNVFYFEMAELYGAEKDYSNQIRLYLELLKANRGYLRTIQSVMNRNWDLEEDNPQTEELFRQLIQRSQTDLSTIVYPEMLIWLYQQQDDFEGAWLQVKAVDQRTQQFGGRAIEYGITAYKQDRFKLSKEVTDYVIGVAQDPDVHQMAINLKLMSLYQNLNSDTATTLEQWTTLAAEFSTDINQIQWPNAEITTLLFYSNIYAYHLQNLQQAIAVTDSIIELQSQINRNVALAKIQKGDYLLLEDEIWEAALLYGQAELLYKHDEIGDEAKLKKAKVSYYDGEFDWALAQLDVLKASTSKKTANDAMALSLLIRDNIPYDSIYLPLEVYAKSDLRYEQGLYQESLDELQVLFDQYENHVVFNDAFYLQYKNYLALQEYDAAIAALKLIYERYPTEPKTDLAVLRLAQLYDFELDNTSEAIKWYEIIVLEYTGSIYGAEAIERYRVLRGDNIQ